MASCGAPAIPDGRDVILTAERWAHVLDRHPHVGLRPEEVVDVVAHPDAPVARRLANEEWFYRRGAGPSAWMVRIPGTITIAGVELDDVTCDREGDVLSLWVGEPRMPAYDDASPEGHYLQFGEDGALIAITIVNARAIYEREGKIPITLPEHRIEATDLGGAVAAA